MKNSIDTVNSKFRYNSLSIWIVYDLISLILLSIISINPSNAISVLVIILLIIGIIYKDISTALLTMIMLFPFEYIVNVSGSSLMFVVNLAFVISVILKKRNQKISVLPIICFMGISSIEIINSGINGVGVGTLLHWATIFLVFTVIILYVDPTEWERKNICLYFLMSYVTVVLTTLYASGGDMSIFLMNTNKLVVSESRFGYSLSSLGGAMGISFYSVINIALLLNNIMNNNISKLYKLISITAIIMSIFIGLLSVSRMFFAELFLILIVFYIHVFISEKKFKKMNIVLISIIIVSMIVNFYGSYLQIIINRTLNRISSASLDIRSEIQIESLNFLFSNPRYFFFGLGVNYYPQFGAIHGYLFRAHTHNLYLDAFMAWGIIGIIFFLTSIAFYIIKNKLYKIKTNSLLSILPLIVILSWYVTAGTFSSYRDYIFILIALNNLNFPGRKTIDEEQ